MVAGVLLTLHVIAAIYAFLKYRKESAKEGLVAVAFVVIIFSVGWTLSTTITSLLLSVTFIRESYDSLQASGIHHLLKKEFNRDTISLIILTGGEAIFYNYFLARGKKEVVSSEGKPLKEEKN